MSSLPRRRAPYHVRAPRGQARGDILDVFNEHGIQIMTPAYEATLTEPEAGNP